MYHYSDEAEALDKNINDIYTKAEQKEKLIAYLIDCFGVTEQQAREEVNARFKDLK